MVARLALLFGYLCLYWCCCSVVSVVYKLRGSVVCCAGLYTLGLLVWVIWVWFWLVSVVLLVALRTCC